MEKPIRVLHVVTYMGRGGLETMLMNYYRHIDRTKVQFDFLVHREFEADYDQEILSMGGRIFHVSRLIPWSRSYKKELKRFFNQHKEYKIIHVHQDCLSSVALKCAKECGIPIRIAHSHSRNQEKNFKYLIKLYYKRKISIYATNLFACSKEAGDWMFNGHSFHLLRNAIDSSLYSYSYEKSIQMKQELGIENNFVIGHVGRFDYQKNQIFLIDIFFEYIKNDPTAKLILIGDGKNKSAIEQKVKKMRLEQYVIFAGIRNDIPEVLQAIDIFIFPSLNEGLGIAAIEAQAASIPCILSDKVPKECKMSQYVQYLSLKDSINKWINQISIFKNVPRVGIQNEIINSGYDINQNAEKLQKFYCEGVFYE